MLWKNINVLPSYRSHSPTPHQTASLFSVSNLSRVSPSVCRCIPTGCEMSAGVVCKWTSHLVNNGSAGPLCVWVRVKETCRDIIATSDYVGTCVWCVNLYKTVEKEMQSFNGVAREQEIYQRKSCYLFPFSPTVAVLTPSASWHQYSYFTFAVSSAVRVLRPSRYKPVTFKANLKSRFGSLHLHHLLKPHWSAILPYPSSTHIYLLHSCLCNP